MPTPTSIVSFTTPTASNSPAKACAGPEANRTRRLDQTSSPVTQIHRPARLATRAASFRYGGGHHSGIPGAIIPLYRATSSESAVNEPAVQEISLAAGWSPIPIWRGSKLYDVSGAVRPKQVFAQCQPLDGYERVIGSASWRERSVFPIQALRAARAFDVLFVMLFWKRNVDYRTMFQPSTMSRGQYSYLARRSRCR